MSFIYLLATICLFAVTPHVTSAKAEVVSGDLDIPCAVQAVQSATSDANAEINATYEIILLEPRSECLINTQWPGDGENFVLEPNQVFWRWKYQINEVLPDAKRVVSEVEVSIPVGQRVYIPEINDWVTYYGSSHEDTLQPEMYWETVSGVTQPSDKVRELARFMALNVAMTQVYLEIPMHRYSNMGEVQLLMVNDENIASGQVFSGVFDCSTGHVNYDVPIMVNSHNLSGSTGYQAFSFAMTAVHELVHVILARKSNGIYKLPGEFVPFGSEPEEAVATSVQFMYLDAVVTDSNYQMVRDTGFLAGVNIAGEVSAARSWWMSSFGAIWQTHPYDKGYKFFNEVRFTKQQAHFLANSALTRCFNGSEPNHLAKTMGLIGNIPESITEVVTRMTGKCLYKDTQNNLPEDDMVFVNQCRYDDLGINFPSVEEKLNTGFTCRRYFGEDFDQRNYWITLPVNENASLLVAEGLEEENANKVLRIRKIKAQGQQVYLNNLPRYTHHQGINVCYANMSLSELTFTLTSIVKGSLTEKIFLPVVH